MSKILKKILILLAVYALFGFCLYVYAYSQQRGCEGICIGLGTLIFLAWLFVFPVIAIVYIIIGIIRDRRRQLPNPENNNLLIK